MSGEFETEAARTQARAFFDTAVAAADPGRCVAQALAADPVREARLLALGKAARPMAQAAMQAAGGAGFREVVVITNAGNDAPLPGARVLRGDHPVPGAASAVAGAECLALAERAAAQGGGVLALISGGGSALAVAPAQGLTLADKARAVELMLAAGLDISAMNAVRQQLSRIKGGGLARAAGAGAMRALILSDVIGDDLRAIASGPGCAPLTTRAGARAILDAAGLWPQMPDAVRRHLAADAPERGLPAPVAHNLLIGSNALSLKAMERAGGVIWDRALSGDVGAAAQGLCARMRGAAAGVYLCGGETTVVVRGAGRGGRNQELALRVAAGMAGVARPWVFLSGGTDGRDGPTEAAGAVVDGGTLARITAAGGDWRALLAANDSNTALALAGDLLNTGATGTNVADVQVIVLG